MGQKGEKCRQENGTQQNLTTMVRKNKKIIRQVFSEGRDLFNFSKITVALMDWSRTS